MSATHERQGHAPAASAIRDEVLRLGPEGQLVGIVSHPPGGTPQSPPQPAVIVLNAGVLHRTGPHRLHVSLSRRLADRGFVTLRLDLGGIGDSIASTDATTFRESAVADTRTAMAGLEGAFGARRFVIFGICAGADNALATALADERVAGVVLVDPAMYETRRSQLRELRRKLAATGSVAAIARRAARVALRHARAALEQWQKRGQPPPPPEEGREYPAPETTLQRVETLLARGVRIFAVYAGNHGAGYNHADQVFETFPGLRGRIDHAYFGDANHTFTQLDDQAQLIESVARWISSRFH